MLSDQGRALVFAAGASAGRRMLDVKECPFDPAGDATERERARVWVGGYLSARPPRLDDVDFSLGGDQ